MGGSSLVAGGGGGGGSSSGTCPAPHSMGTSCANKENCYICTPKEIPCTETKTVSGCQSKGGGVYSCSVTCCGKTFTVTGNSSSSTSYSCCRNGKMKPNDNNERQVYSETACDIAVYKTGSVNIGVPKAETPVPQPTPEPVVEPKVMGPAVSVEPEVDVNAVIGTEFDYGCNCSKEIRPLGNTVAGAVPDNAYFFDPFPNMKRIKLWLNRYDFSASVPYLCPGKSIDFITQAQTERATIAADTTSGSECWNWTCNSGYSMIAGGECINATECNERGLIWEDNTCKAPTFCSGWSGYDPTQHIIMKNGSCFEFRCQVGGFKSLVNRSCETREGLNVADLPQSRNGWYLNNNINDDTRGTLMQCSETQYVTVSNGVYSCVPLKPIQRANFENCWKCASKDTIIQCLSNDVSCE